MAQIGDLKDRLEAFLNRIEPRLQRLDNHLVQRAGRGSNPYNEKSVVASLGKAADVHEAILVSEQIEEPRTCAISRVANKLVSDAQRGSNLKQSVGNTWP